MMTSNFIKRRKNFKIKEITSQYNPENKPLPSSFKILNSYPSSHFRGKKSTNHYIYIQKCAFKTIEHHIGFGEGKDTPDNIVEQGGILLGKTFIDTDKEITYGVVEQAIEGKLAKGTNAYLEMTHETWKEMLDKTDELLGESGSEFQIIGWYHTHPNMLDVFMSGTDKATQARLFGNDWQFAIVLNPQKSIWRAFYGRYSQECKGHIIENEEKNDE